MTDNAATRFPICAESERLSASRPRLFGAAEFRSGARRPAGDSCCASRISTPRDAGRNSRPRSTKTSPGSASPGKTPVRRQSEHLRVYREAVEKLSAAGLIYPSFREPRRDRPAGRASGKPTAPWPRDPDGAPLYPGAAKSLPPDERAAADRIGRALRAAARHGGGLRARRRARLDRARRRPRRRDRRRSPRGRKPGATSSWRARRRRPAIICRW